jgi:hypothetical protein
MRDDFSSEVEKKSRQYRAVVWLKVHIVLSGVSWLLFQYTLGMAILISNCFGCKVPRGWHEFDLLSF